MLDESIVQFIGRIRVHATKRVESKRNEVMAVPVTDLPVRLDVIVVYTSIHAVACIFYALLL